MTDVYSTNLFDLLGEDSNEGFPKAVPVTKPAEVKPASSSPAVSDTRRGGRGGERGTRGGRGGGRGDAERGGYRGRGDGERRGGRRPDGERRPPRNEENGDVPRERNVAPRFNRENEEETGDGFERKEGGRGRGRRQVGGPSGRGAFRGAREFDRQSGNDWDDGVKKEIAGKGTWGDKAEAQIEAKADAEVAVVVEATEEKPVEAPKEVEPEVKSFEQYQAELAAKRASLASTSVRVANNGEDNFGDAIKFKRTDDEEVLFSGKAEKVKKVKEIKEKPVKIALEIEQRFSDESHRGSETRGRGRGDRGGRGRGDERRGGERRGGRGGARGGKQSEQPYINIEDPTAFPSLSK
ncbi:hypothetical protein HK096_006200 [Nowakowskiella sp. JEL0078]|nr:hypothetical protein HK096_006200 [Nowakowskiella sp. JEL0078]